MLSLENILKEHIKNSGHSIYSLSKLSDVNQTTLQRALNGERPISRENLNKIIGHLDLTPSESEEIETAFLINKLGKYTYLKNTFIKTLLETNPRSFTTSDSSIRFCPLKLTDTKIVNGRMNILNTVCRLLSSNENTPSLYAVSHYQDSFFKTLYEQLQHAELKHLKIIHIIPFVKETKDHPETTLFNIKIIEQLLPTTLYSDNTNMEFYYYYENEALPSLSGIPYPYYIVTDSNAILLSADYETAHILPKDNSDYFRQTFLQLLAKSTPLINTTNDTTVNSVNLYPGTLQYSATRDDAPFVIAFSKKQFETFIQTKPNNESMTKKQKIQICQKMLDSNLYSMHKYTILQDSKLLPKIGICIHDDNAITFHAKDINGKYKTCSFSEHNFVQSFHEYFMSLDNLQYAYPIEETNAILQTAISHLEANVVK